MSWLRVCAAPQPLPGERAKRSLMYDLIFETHLGAQRSASHRFREIRTRRTAKRSGMGNIRPREHTSNRFNRWNCFHFPDLCARTPHLLSNFGRDEARRAKPNTHGPISHVWALCLLFKCLRIYLRHHRERCRVQNARTHRKVAVRHEYTYRATPPSTPCRNLARNGGGGI